jgi:hypothetical protein
MKILRRGAKQAEPDEIDAESADDALVGAEPAEEPGPHLLSDGPLLARWYILYELEKEMKRATRHERALSVMVLEPTPTLGAAPSEESLLQAAEAARRSSRVTDLIGWLPNGGILIVMPETDKDGAAAAVYRWRNEMYTSTLRHGAVRWRVATNVNASSFETPGALLEAVGGELRPVEEEAA